MFLQEPRVQMQVYREYGRMGWTYSALEPRTGKFLGKYIQSLEELGVLLGSVFFKSNLRGEIIREEFSEGVMYHFSRFHAVLQKQFDARPRSMNYENSALVINRPADSREGSLIPRSQFEKLERILNEEMKTYRR
jgi:hypothetical protein